MLLLAACGSGKGDGAAHTLPQQIPNYTEEEYEEQDHEWDPLFDSYEDSYLVHEWKEEQTGISRPYGICVAGDAVFVCDFDNHCIVKLDQEGERIASYGTLGAKKGNFTNPTAIVCHDGQLYVLDQGNHRVQIFDMDMNYQREVPYAAVTFDKNDYFQDMAVDQNGTIYLSVWTNASTYGVYYLSEEGRAVAVEPRISGALTEYQGEVYAMNTFMNYKVNGAYNMGWGENFFLKCTAGGLEQLAELPYKYTPADFCIVNDRIYAVSLHGYERQLNRLTLEGKLDSAVYIFETKERDWSNIINEPATFPFFLDVVDDDHIYAVDSLWKTVYYFEKK